MTRYQACKAIGVDPISAAFVSFVHFLAGVPEGRIAILHMEITYNPNQPYRRGIRFDLEERK